MFERKKMHDTLGEHAILGNENVAELLTKVEQLQGAVTELKDRIDAQFTTTAAHAEISRQQVELARSEARADLDRTRDTLIGLIEQVRFQRPGEPSSGYTSGSSPTVEPERLEAIELRVAELVSTVERCFSRQNELADTMAAIIDSVLAGQRGEPVAGLSLT